MMLARTVLAFTCVLPCVAGSLQLNSSAFDTGQFQVTQFATGLPNPISMALLSDGSLAVATYYSGILRFTDSNFNGLADAAGVSIYPALGAHTSMVTAGGYYIDGNFGEYASGHFDQQAMTILKPGSDITATNNMSVAGVLKLDYPDGWEHSQIGMATRPTPGHTGSYDLVFNVGSQYDAATSTGKVQLSGLVSATLDGDSLYAVTLDLSGSTPTASNVRKIAAGIRNVIGMGFQPGTGDFYFADNAIDGTGPFGDEPPQAEELNRILASDFDSGTVPDFGYPNCYIGYRSGSAVGTGCVQPYYAIQPIANGTLLGSESEGATQMVFAPPNFPAAFSNGVFIGFSGKGFRDGPANEENGVGYYDFTTGQYVHFVENSQVGVYMPIGLLSTPNALYIADFASGTVYQVTATAPEPGTWMLGLAGLAGLVALRQFRRLRTSRRILPY